MKVKAPHSMSQDEAKQRMIGMAEEQAMVIEWLSEYNAVGSLSYNGTTIQGAIDITPSEVVLDFELPRLALIFASRIEREVKKQIESALA